jgi:hypothetical protein
MIRRRSWRLAALQKNPPRAGSHFINITKLEIHPSGQDVVIAASFCIAEKWDPTEALSGCGSGYLRGVPQYDPKSQTIRIVNVHYDVLTENWMLSVMRGLAGDDLGKGLEKALQFKVGDQIGKVRHQVSAALAHPQGSVVTVSGHGAELRPGDTDLEPRRLRGDDVGRRQRQSRRAYVRPLVIEPVALL